MVRLTDIWTWVDGAALGSSIVPAHITCVSKLDVDYEMHHFMCPKEHVYYLTFGNFYFSTETSRTLSLKTALTIMP